MIVSTPVNLPSLVPDSWDKWWDVWATHAQPLTKEGTSPNKQYGQWLGFDVMVTEKFKTVYTAPAIDLEQIYPSFHKQLKTTLQEFDVYGVRFVQSQSAFPAHKDNFIASWQLRCLMSGEEGQWYYERLQRTDRRQLKLSPTTNWWAYLDGMCLHGTHFNPDAKKILVQVYAHHKGVNKLAQDSIPLYESEYQVKYE